MNEKLKKSIDAYEYARSFFKAKSCILFDEIEDFDRVAELEEVLSRVIILDKISKEMTKYIDRICYEPDKLKLSNKLIGIFDTATTVLENTSEYIDALLMNIIGMKYFDKEDNADEEFKKKINTVTTGALCTWSKLIDQLAKLGQ